MPLSATFPHPSASAAFAERRETGGVRLVFFAKVTHALAAPTSSLASFQEPLYAEEQRWDPRRPERIDRACDLCGDRPGIDVVLVAPTSGFPASPVRLVLGALDQTHALLRTRPRRVPPECHTYYFSQPP